MQGGRRNGDMSFFSDPFGSKSGRNVFSSFFDRDPFDDPFFTRPFGSASILGPEGFFGRQNGFIDDQEYEVPQSVRRGPVIEELPDDNEDGRNESSQEPIVEDPDDDQGNTEQRTQRQRGNQSVYQGTNNSYPRQSSSQTFSFQSSKVTYGGQNGAYYTSSTTISPRKESSGDLLLHLPRIASLPQFFIHASDELAMRNDPTGTVGGT
uniref:Uncharacterized protein n=1 Tax=Picea sitchensis TaxID=3332 RepID=A9P1E6_PICSI|nr:unknown [Picea sitchensis]